MNDPKNAESPPSTPASATPSTNAPAPKGGPTFEEDLGFLRAHGDVIVLESKEGARVAISSKYQGRVMTSAVSARGTSLGFIHRAFIEEGKTGTAFDNYGGEDRFWLGPEGGQFGLYFPPGAPFAFDRWQTPHAMQEGEWSVAARTPESVTFAREMTVTNWSKTEMRIGVKRTVSLLSADAVAKAMHGAIPSGVEWVAFQSENTITNLGTTAWTEDKGLPSIWILGMFTPARDATVILPFEKNASGPVVKDDYFGKVPAERLLVSQEAGTVRFSCDGQLRSKIGLGPARAKDLAMARSPSQNLLTIVSYDKPPGVTRYVNSAWETQATPYAGDVINSYNDGPVAPGKKSLGGFYEVETSSPAAALSPGASLTHTHRTIHLVGGAAALDAIAK